MKYCSVLWQYWTSVFITELEMPLYPPSWRIPWHAAGTLEQLQEDSSSLPMSFLNFIVLLAEARMLCKSKFQLAEVMSGHGEPRLPQCWPCTLWWGAAPRALTCGGPIRYNQQPQTRWRTHPEYICRALAGTAVGHERSRSAGPAPGLPPCPHTVFQGRLRHFWAIWSH